MRLKRNCQLAWIRFVALLLIKGQNSQLLRNGMLNSTRKTRKSGRKPSIRWSNTSNISSPNKPKNISTVRRTSSRKIQNLQKSLPTSLLSLQPKLKTLGQLYPLLPHKKTRLNHTSTQTNSTTCSANGTLTKTFKRKWKNTQITQPKLRTNSKSSLSISLITLKPRKKESNISSVSHKKSKILDSELQCNLSPKISITTTASIKSSPWSVSRKKKLKTTLRPERKREIQTKNL